MLSAWLALTGSWTAGWTSVFARDVSLRYGGFVDDGVLVVWYLGSVEAVEECAGCGVLFDGVGLAVAYPREVRDVIVV